MNPRKYLPNCKNPISALSHSQLIYANDARPAQQAAIFLATYDFTNANKLFGYHLIHATPEKSNQESPFATYLSATSYLLQHAYRYPRISDYAEINLFTLRILTEDSTLCKLLCSDDEKRKIRLCRQRQPYLPGNWGPSLGDGDIRYDDRYHISQPPATPRCKPLLVIN